MIIILKNNIAESEVNELIVYLESRDVKFNLDKTGSVSIIKVEPGGHKLNQKQIEDFSAVEAAIRISPAAPMVSIGKKPVRPDIRGVIIGGDDLTIIAGPCSLESEEQMQELAIKLKDAGIDILRAGAYKPRTSPYSFQGMGAEGLKILKSISEEHNLPVITEILDIRDIDLIYESTDIFQVGMRNMRNYALLKEIGKSDKPVMLKRASDATVSEWLLAAEYLFTGGNENVILCERGISTVAGCGGITLDLNGALEAKMKSRLPIIADPSHGAADRKKVAPLARAAVAAGLDGVMIEVHSNPAHALSDGFQALYPDSFAKLVSELKAIHKVVRGNRDED